MEDLRWNGIPICPYCGSDRATQIWRERRYHCNKCYLTFSVTAQTIFHQTHLPLHKWFIAIHIYLNTRQKFTVREVAEMLDINKDTAWRIITKLKEAMLNHEQRSLLEKIAGKEAS